MNMQKIIASKLDKIEKNEDVRIIFAVESGSRAWGFESPDSDYDVRFVYVRPKSYYLKLEQTRDVIEWQLDETLDINGWDLSKILRLLHKSNPTIFEWSNSPIVYRQTNDWKKIANVLSDYFSAKSGSHHYINMATGNYRKYLKNDEVRLKKYLYVLRPILACKWIINEQTPPPMQFSKLVKSKLDNPAIKNIVEDLLKRKITGAELTTSKRIDTLNEYIEENISLLKYAINNMPKESAKSWDKLNELFTSII